MSNNIFNELKIDIEKKMKAFNRGTIPSWYNGEQKYKERYKGREILEIIQNAEDAQATELIFSLDEENSKIIISNNGENFSSEGYRSLLYTDLSSKPKGVFIGQKGLGFRALINWAKEISILSNNLKITFSEDLSKKLLKELKDKDSDLKDINDMQFLSIPTIEEVLCASTGVIIELIYDQKKDFNQQFNSIDEECFFFLKNLKKIETPISTIEQICSNNIIFEEKIKELPDNYYEEEELKNKVKQKIYYSIKLIWNPEKNYKDFPLYTYFRTNVKIGSPILIHAGFDLSDDRNSIEKTKRNEFLIDEICQCIEKLIDKITEKHKDWSAYKLLNHQIQCERDSMFERIGECFEYCKNKKNIYPSIDGELKSVDDIIILDNDVTEFILKLRKKYKDIDFYDLSNVAVPVYDSEIELNINKHKYYEIFNLLSKKIPVDDIDERAILIKLFYENANDYCIQKPAIFIDNYNEIIPEDDEVFSQFDKDFDMSLIPSFCKYRVINNNLNRKLINEKILTQSEIENCINKIYPANIKNIFLILTDNLNECTEEANKKILYSNLFKMYKKYRNEIEISKDYFISILCDDGQYYTENFVFNNGFDVEKDKILGVLDKFICNNDKIHRIAEKKYWSFLNATDIELKNFFEFVGVSSSIDYESIDSQSELFVYSLQKEEIVILAILDFDFYNFIKEENNIVSTIKRRKLFSDYVINTKKINFLNNGLLDKSIIKKYSNDENKINTILKLLGAQDSIDTISQDRFVEIIKNLRYWDSDGENARVIYEKALANEIKIKGETYYYSKNKDTYFSNKELYYYDNKCLPSSKLEQFPTIDLGRRKGHINVSKCFNVKSIEDYKVQLVGKPIIDLSLTEKFLNDLKNFYPIILAYRFAIEPLGEDMKKNQTNALKNIDIKICRELTYTFNNTLNKEILEDFDFINSDGVFYFKIPDQCKTVDDIREYKKELYDFVSEMLLMTFKLNDNNSYIKDNAVQTYIFNDIKFSTSRFEDDNDRLILREAEDYLDYINYREEFWKHIHRLKNIEEDYEIWEQKQETKKTFSTSDYTQFNENLLEIFEEDDVSITLKDFLKDYPYKNNIDFSEYNKNQIINFYNSEIVKNIEKYIWYQCNKKTDNLIKFNERKNSIHWENISYLFNSCNYLIEDFEKEIWLKLKEINYDKDKVIEIISSNVIDFETIYKKNCAIYNHEEIDIIKQFSDFKSLLYFENTEAKIRERLIKYFEKKERNNKDEQVFLDEQRNEIKWSNVKFSLPEKKSVTEKNSNLNKHSKQTSFSSIERAKNNIEKGRLIEKIAFNYLNNSAKYIDIIDVSDRCLGYDFQCIEKITKSTIYVEVKSFSIDKGYFEITENEYRTWQNNKDRYVFFLYDINQEPFLIEGKEIEAGMTITPNSYRCKLK